MLKELGELIREELDGLTGSSLRYAANNLRRLLDELDPRPEAERPPVGRTMTEQEAHDYGRMVQLYGRPIRDVDAEALGRLVDQHRLQWWTMMEYLRWRRLWGS